MTPLLEIDKTSARYQLPSSLNLATTNSVFNKIVSMDNPRVIQMEVKSLNSDIVEVDFVDDSGRSASDLVCESMVLRQASIPETDDFVLASSGLSIETILLNTLCVFSVHVCGSATPNSLSFTATFGIILHNAEAL
jgi:hypothetical protein